jgi:hypothetical protein
MAQLRAKVPDVAAMVEDGRLTLEAGLSELKQRQHNVRGCIDDAADCIAEFKGAAKRMRKIEAALALNDSELAMIDLEREEMIHELLDGLSSKEITEIADAAETLRQAKQANVVSKSAASPGNTNRRGK